MHSGATGAASGIGLLWDVNVQGVFDDIQGPAFCFVVHAEKILSKESNADQLYAPEKQDGHEG
jgi:hypothetical protein